MAQQYQVASDTEKNTIIDSSYGILKSKNSNFTIAQVFFSIGTLAYSSLFVMIDIVPEILGWFGIISAILYGLGNIINYFKNDSRILWNIGGLLILIYELVLGGWLLF